MSALRDVYFNELKVPQCQIKYTVDEYRYAVTVLHAKIKAFVTFCSWKTYWESRIFLVCIVTCVYNFHQVFKPQNACLFKQKLRHTLGTTVMLCFGVRFVQNQQMICQKLFIQTKQNVTYLSTLDTDFTYTLDEKTF